LSGERISPLESQSEVNLQDSQSFLKTYWDLIDASKPFVDAFEVFKVAKQELVG
jgi:hypothetical protein